MATTPVPRADMKMVMSTIVTVGVMIYSPPGAAVLSVLEAVCSPLAWRKCVGVGGGARIRLVLVVVVVLRSIWLSGINLVHHVHTMRIRVWV
jgi:hypothetical protein